MKTKFYLIGLMVILVSSCKKFLAIDGPKNSLVQSQIFKSNEVALAAINGAYSHMAISGYASGGSPSVTINCGLTSDELMGYTAGREFFENEIAPTSSLIASGFWQRIYQSIYMANAILEGLDAPNGVTNDARPTIEGEALFIRAFANFYLVNLFGDAPLNLTTDYRVNQIAIRTSKDIIYNQILTDLLTAEGLLKEAYPSPERVRPNKSTVHALLARVYLYRKDWSNAEKYATLVLDKTSTYKLVACDDVFLKGSLEAIWQLMPAANTNTREGSALILTATPTLASLYPAFATNGFEPNDKRKAAWVRSYTNATGTYYYPFKYKVKSSTTVSEYSVVFRLAEQFLIRSEARAWQNKLVSAIEDIDAIRSRAGITLIKNTNPSITRENLLLAIYGERKTELFTEWGHRWFDLIRTERADQVLTPIKPKYKSTDILFPLPQGDLDKNKKLTQNDGYF